MYQLPIFRGYTVDERLREFRRVAWTNGDDPSLEVVPFDSPKGLLLLAELLLELQEGAGVPMRAVGHPMGVIIEPI